MEVEAQAHAAALAAGGKPKMHTLETVDLSWPTMLCAKCKTKAQYELYNRLLSTLPNVGPSRHSILSSCGEGGYQNVNNVNKGVIDEPCTCMACVTDPPQPFNLDGHCNCSGCVPENISLLVKPPPPPTILSTILLADQISAVARAHGEAVLAGFHKDIW